MKSFDIIRRKVISRRTMLRGVGAMVGLPFLDAMLPAVSAKEDKPATPMRFVAMQYGLGFHSPFLVPKQQGKDFELSPYLEQLKGHRQYLTVVSGISHPEQRGANGHTSEMTWLTGARHPGLPGFRNTISIDVMLAEKLGPVTRFPQMALSSAGSDSLSWTSNGVNLPAETSPAKVFRNLFVEGTPAEKKQQLDDLERGKSILDSIRMQAAKLKSSLGKIDQRQLEQYFTAIRDMEKKIAAMENWATKPKPIVKVKPPVDVADRTDILAKTKLMHDLMLLALQTDSTRIISYKAGGMNAVPKIPGVSNDWHNLSHHGQDQQKIDELKVIEMAEFAEVNRFLEMLKATTEAGSALLDRTTVLVGSNLSNASSHDATNLPLVLAGGQFRHGSHIAFDRLNNGPFASLFVSIAQQMGVSLNEFAYASSTLKGLDIK
ncbi:MAG: DUF1552 domain-containing protein [Zavarzinella sp.]